MKTHFYFTIFLAIMVLAGCKKSAKETTVYGQVRTFGTEEAIRHAPVKVQLMEKEVSSTLFSPPNYKILEETMTDQNQNYSFTYKLYSSVQYYIGVKEESISKSKYIPPNGYSSLGKDENQIKSVGGEVVLNYYVVPKGWIRLHVVSENPEPGDQFSYNGGAGYPRNFGGGNIDEQIVFPTQGNHEHELSFSLRRNGDYT